MYSLFLIFLTFIVSIISLAAPRKCNVFFQNGGWLQKTNVSTPIPAIKFQSGLSLISGRKSDLYFTKYFLKEAKLDLSLTSYPVQSIKINTYRYHQPNTEISWYLPGKEDPQIRSNRGGGRDHIVNTDKAIAVKGSGTNSLFSQSNHKKFDLLNFRRNGLMLLEDGLIAYILAKQMKSLSLNIIDIPELVIADESIQKLVNKNSKNEQHQYIVQLHRDMSNARESMENTTQPKEGHHHINDGVYQLASDILLFNIAHGAINPENMGHGGQIMDLGHVSFGYPLMSYNYRCTLCRGIEGGSSDKTLIGILDHYFGNNFYSTNRTRSYSFQLKNTDINRIIEKTIARLGGEINSSIKVTRKESIALRNLFKEKITLWGHREADLFYNEVLTKEFIKLYSTNIEKETLNDGDFSDWQFSDDPIESYDFGQETDGNFFQDELSNPSDDLLPPIAETTERKPTNTWMYIWPERKAISYRFMWRVAAQKKFLSTKSYMQFKKSIEEILNPNVLSDFNTIIELFEKTIDTNNLKRSDFNKIFQEFIPSNLLKYNIDQMISKASSQEEIVLKSQKIIEQFQKPITFEPKDFRKLISKINRSLKRKRHEFIQKKVDEINQNSELYGGPLEEGFDLP